MTYRWTFAAMTCMCITASLWLPQNSKAAEQSVIKKKVYSVGCASCSRSNYSWRQFESLDAACDAAKNSKELYVNLLVSSPNAQLPRGKRWFLSPEIPFRVVTQTNSGGQSQWKISKETYSEAEAAHIAEEQQALGTPALILEVYESLEANSQTSIPSKN